MTYLFHWLVGLLGICAFMVLFSFMPSLFGVEISANVVLRVMGIPLSAGIIDAFSYEWQLGLLIVGAGLFAWICFMFLMSTHNLVVGIVSAATQADDDGEKIAVTIMSVGLLFLSLVFTWVMFGTLFTLWGMVYAFGLIVVTGLLLYFNYSEIVDI